MQWEIKVSKLCNMRCRYCYEWEELAKRDRVSLAGWRAILESARWYQEELERRNPGTFVYTEFVWHGGEPLLLPVEYYESVLRLQREVLGAENLNRIYSNHVPTNLLAVPPRTLELLRRERFQIALSFDGAPGTRLDIQGRATEERVAANLRRLLADGWTLGCNTVAAAHNAGQLARTYETIRDWVYASPGRLYLNLIPLHATPTEGEAAPFSLPAERCVEAMFALFERWAEDPRPLPLFPLQRYYVDVIRKLSGLERDYFDRRDYGESSLVVNTDGHVYAFNDAYDREKSIGCLFETPFRQLLRSEAYEASLRRYEALVARHCRGCPYDGYCDRGEMITGHRDEPGERCAIAFPLHRKIEEWLVERGYTAAVMRQGLPDLPRREFVTE
jgi:uncharacterized protein